MSKVRTWNPKNVVVTLGNHIATGFAEDSFITIEQPEDGVTSKTGCDGEVVRSINPSNTYNVKLVLLWGSATNKFLLDNYNRDRKDGEGTYPIEIKDLGGGTLFTASVAWATKNPGFVAGKEAQNREWNLVAADGDFREE